VAVAVVDTLIVPILVEQEAAEAADINAKLYL
jgi:hypothetical protein